MKIKLFTIFALMTILTACGGGSDNNSDDNTPADNNEKIQGTTFGANIIPIKSLLNLIAPPAYADIQGLQAITGAAVNLYKLLPASGTTPATETLVATTVSADDASGTFSFDKPADFDVNHARYEVRISKNNKTLTSRVYATNIEVTPETDYVNRELKNRKLSEITNAILDEFLEAVRSVEFVNVPRFANNRIETIRENINNQINKNEGVKTRVSSLKKNNNNAKLGAIKGRVNGVNAGVLIIAKSFKEQLNYAKTKTDADGNFTLRVPVAGSTESLVGNVVITNTGDYIIGVYVRNKNIQLASGWYKKINNNSNNYAQLIRDGSKISVTSSETSQILDDITLDPGATVYGKITNHAGAPIKGVNIRIKDYHSRYSYTGVNTKTDGSYVMNVPLNKQFIMQISNRSPFNRPFASMIYAGQDHKVVSSRSFAKPFSISADKEVNPQLPAGYKVSGKITDPIKDNEDNAKKNFIKVYDNQDIMQALRLNAANEFSTWLERDRLYKIVAHGANQVISSLATNTHLIISSTTTMITGKVVDSGNKPIARAKVFLRTITGGSIAQDNTSSDGIFTIFTTATESDNTRLEIRVDDGRQYGVQIYNNASDITSGSNPLVGVVVPGGSVTLSDITMNAGGLLRGIITGKNNIPLANYGVQVRRGGTAYANHLTHRNSTGDGSYIKSLDVGTYERIRSTKFINNKDTDGVTIALGTTTIVNFNDPSLTLATLQFDNKPVYGMNYIAYSVATSTIYRTNTTNISGQFVCVYGEKVTFSLGAQTLGTVICQSTIALSSFSANNCPEVKQIVNTLNGDSAGPNYSLNAYRLATNTISHATPGVCGLNSQGDGNSISNFITELKK